MIPEVWQPKRDRKRALARRSRRCEHCARLYRPRTDKVRTSRFCSKACAEAGMGRMVPSFSGDGADNPRWRGGISRDFVRYIEQQRERYPERVVARRLVLRAVGSGKLVRQPCNRCGWVGKTHGHHADYSKPLQVEWLCRPCHVAHHQAERRNAEHRQGAAA